MPFEIETKTEMFIRCARLCCLCLKQCGTNIEAAHIIDEANGGSNDADNGIPACFDCHQEIGAYNDRHPKGNKFRPAELKARRDRIYHLVETGVIFAQVVALRTRSSHTSERVPELPESSTRPRPSAEAERFLKALLSSDTGTTVIGRKLSLLNQHDRAHILDELVRKTVEGAALIPVVAEIIQSPNFPRPEAILVTEQIVRAITLYGDVPSKAEFLRTFSDDIVAEMYEGLRLAFFEDIINIVKRDQFSEVNKIVPPLVEHARAMPPGLYKEYVCALLGQANSGSYAGAPAAQRALESLPETIAKVGIRGIDEQFVVWNSREEHLKKFVARFGHLGNLDQKQLFEDLLKLSYSKFMTKYLAEEEA